MPQRHVPERHHGIYAAEGLSRAAVPASDLQGRPKAHEIAGCSNVLGGHPPLILR